MVCSSHTVMLAAIGIAIVCHFPVPARAQDEKLVPARFNQLTDKRGNRWDINPYGAVGNGTNDCFNTGGQLQIDGSSISFSRVMMTADGSEFVLAGRYRSLGITRRVRLDAETGALRYLEILENQTTTPQHIVATIQTGLGSSAQQVVTVKDQLLLGSLGKEDGAFVAIQSGGRPSVIFVVADPKAKIKPVLRMQNNRTFSVLYTADIPVGGTIVFAHYLAQRMNGTAKDASEILGTYYKRGKLIDPNIPKAYLAPIANFSVGGSKDEVEEKTAPLLAPLQMLAESAELPRGMSDGLVIDAESKLIGTVTGGDFELETLWGKTSIAFADIAGIAGGAGVQRLLRVFLRSGEILTGTARGAKFAMKTASGLALDVDLDQIHLLTLRTAEGDGVAPEQASILVTTERGDRLILGGSGTAPLEAATPWGLMRVNLAELQSLTSVREPFPSHRLVLADGSRLTVMLRGGEWIAPTLRFGPVKLVPQSIRELQRVARDVPPAGDAEDEQKIAGPHCDLVGDNRLAGMIDLPALHLTAESSVTPVEPKQILQLEAQGANEAEASFTIKLIGGQELKGRLVETFLPIRSGSRVWRVPSAHIVAFRALKPSPEKPSEEKPVEPKSVEREQKPAAPAVSRIRVIPSPFQ